MDAGAARRFVEDLEAWLRERRLADLVTREDVQRALDDLRKDEAFWTRVRPQYEQAWDRVEARLRAEKRPLRELLSDEAVQRVLDAVEALEPDPEAVRAFLRSPAFEGALGQVLYAGIREFMRKADLLGALVNKLPVIGPIRKKFMSIVADEFEPRLEGQIKAFLGGFSGMAVERMIQSVLAPENRDGFRAARRRLAEHLLARPVHTLLPDPAVAARWRQQVWDGVRGASVKDEAQLLDWLFQDHGEATLGAWVSRSRPAQDVVVRSLERFLQDDKGKAWRLGPDGAQG